MIKSVAFALIASASAATSQGVETGGDLQALCNSVDPEGKAFCTAFILGGAQGIQASEMLTKYQGGTPKVCIPAAATGRDVIDLVKQGLLADPTTNEFPVGTVILFALIDAFPCP